MSHDSIPPEYAGWWRIIETSAWVTKALDTLGPALISLGTGNGDRLRVLAIVAHATQRDANASERIVHNVKRQTGLIPKSQRTANDRTHTREFGINEGSCGNGGVICVLDAISKRNRGTP